MQRHFLLHHLIAPGHPLSFVNLNCEVCNFFFLRPLVLSYWIFLPPCFCLPVQVSAPLRLCARSNATQSRSSRLPALAGLRAAPAFRGLRQRLTSLSSSD